jgi:hypothetical protein
MTLRDRLEKAGIETRSYSGRGMYGKTCLGAVADSREAIYSVIRPADIRSASVDSMGRGVLVYWPSVAWDGGAS